MEELFAAFPKKRSELPEAYKKIYFKHYSKNRAGSTPASFFSKRMEAWLHKKVAADCKDGGAGSTLEIGAGTLNHLAYEQSEPYDVIEPLEEFYKGSEYLSRVNKIYSDISEIDSNTKYDRILSIANFEHVLHLPDVVAKASLLLKDGGCLRVSIPNEGTFLWWLAYNFTTGIEFRIRFGLNYSVFMKHEHVNTAREIEEVLNYFFKEVKSSYFGLSKKIAFYRFYECKLPETDKARSYLAK